MATVHLNGHHRRTLASIFLHPASHNVEWHDVLSLLRHIGTAEDSHNGTYYVTVGSSHLNLGQSHDKNLGTDELHQLRDFLITLGLLPDSRSLTLDRQ